MRAAMGGKLLVTAAVAAALTVGFVASGTAQDATPTAGEPAPAAYANHIHAGTCDNLDPAPAAALADLQFPEWVAALDSTDPAAAATIGNPADLGNAPIPVAVATTEVQVPLADIVSGGHAINVHDAADPSVYIACGNIGGMTDENGDLFVGLDPVDDSGFSGVAWLHDNGSSTTVVVFLSHPSQQDEISAGLEALKAAAATPAAETPAAATPEAAPEGTPVA
ncbi:MAG: hypothetical protein U0031_23780 [Thermomicrobiales bacterium]